LRQAADIYGPGQYGDAANHFESLRRAALAVRDDYIAARATGNLGACQFALHQYQPALRSFLEAHRLANQAGDASYTAVLDVNIASLYSEMGELEAAAQWIKGALERMSGDDRREHLPKLLIQLAIVRALQDRMPEASELFRQGTDGADRAGDLELYAIGWNRLGEEFLKRGDLPQAEAALLEAYRVRKLHKLDLEGSYRNLGRLRLAQGDLASASALLDRAVELAARPQGPIPSWEAYHFRGRVRLAQGRLREALADLRIAARLARAWRWSAAPYDDARTGAEGMLDQVYSALVEAGNRLYLETGDPALIRETFEAAEENRASSLQELLFGRRATSVDVAASWEALDRLQREEAEALRTQDPHALDVVRATRAEIVRMQALPTRLPILQPPACWNALGPRSIPVPLCSASTWAIPSPGCGRWTGMAWRSTSCRRARRSSLRSKPRRAPSAKIRRMPDRLAPICTALFSGRWMPGFDTGRAGCWRWTRGFSTFP
jgi:tetratricopeptide (TPR) repeat protein